MPEWCGAMREPVLVVTDVDNTVYDWVAIWAGAFDALIRTLVQRTGRQAADWLATARAVHVRRTTTECPSLLPDMAASPDWPASADPRLVMPSAASAYRNYWDHHLVPYPGIRAALVRLHEQGCVIVAYTEGDATIAAARLARLGLAGVIRCVFGRPPSTGALDPSCSLVTTLRGGPIAVDFIPREDAKPHPAGLRSIIARLGGVPHRTIHLGDNLWKDVSMARMLGVPAFWARYGTRRVPEHVQLLERVAHWSAGDIALERRVTPATAPPDVTLDDAAELADAVWRHLGAAAAV